MFDILARGVIRGRWIVIIAWLALAAGMFFLAPSLAQVGTASDAAFLPDDSPSLIAQDVLGREFPGLATAGQGLVVAYNKDGLSQANRDYIQSLVKWLHSPDAPSNIGTVTSVFDQAELENLLVSKDATTMLVRMDYTSPPYSDSTNEAISAIRDHIRSTVPAGLQVDLTGQAAISKDLFASILDSVSKTTIVTILLVVFVLLFIYRAPVAAGIPLVTIGVAFVITRGLLGLFVQAGIMRVSSMVEAFSVVLIFGAGTDYALFLISRYREEVAKRPDHDRKTADIQTVAKIGPVITASASTVIIATLGMVVARFEMTRTMGPALAMGIFIALLASLTLTPALLSVFGKLMFWPSHERMANDSGEVKPSPTWQRIAMTITTRPGVVASVITLVLLLPYLALPHLTRSFDVLSELPGSVESRAGFELLRQHFDQGEMLPVSVVLTDNTDLQSPQGLVEIANVSAALQGLKGVDKVRSVISPGTGNTADLEKNLLAQQQVLTLTQQLRNNLGGVSADSLASGKSNPASQLDNLTTYLDELGAAFPDVKQGQTYASARKAVDDLRTQVNKSVEGLQVSTQLDDLSTQVAASAQGTPQAVDNSGSGGLQPIQAYLDELAQAYPEVLSDAGFTKANDALGSLAQSAQAQKKQSQVSAQLGLLSGQMAALAQELSTLQALLATPEPGQPAPAEQLSVVSAYLRELGQAYPEVTAQPAYADALSALQRMEAGFTQVAAGSAGGSVAPAQLQALEQGRVQLQAGAAKVSSDLKTLAAPFAGRDAPLNSRTLGSTPQAQAAKATAAQALVDLQTGLSGLAVRFQRRDARFVPKSLPQSDAQTRTRSALKSSTDNLASALDSLAAAIPADAYFIPASLIKGQPGLGKLVDAFLSKDRQAAQLQVLLATDPYSEQALNTVDAIDSTSSDLAAGAGLSAYTGGPTAQVRDIHSMVDSDLPKVMAVVIGGVFLVFVLLLGSLVAPIYLVATVLLSYGTTMGIITLLFQDTLKQTGVNYVIPTIILVLLVALGADYNIFLISRVWEEADKLDNVREGVRRASAYTGGVITSAGIILAGTFAALTVAPIQTLSQVGAAVALGVLVDTFIVRALLVPAIAALVGKYNWWPAKHPAGQGGAFQLLAERRRERAARRLRGVH